MIKSMTAFARYRAECDWGSATIELKTVNHRYLDCNFRLPENLRELEMSLRDKIRQYLHRGKLDCSVRVQFSKTCGEQLSVNINLLEQLHQAAKSIEEKTGVNSHYDTIQLLQWPGLLQASEQDLSAVFNDILQAMEYALAKLNQVRQREGEALTSIILERLEGITQQVSIVKPRIPEVIDAQHKKLSDRVAELAVNCDEERMAQEVAILAQRLDVDEELDRLTAHIKEVKHVLSQQESVGRRLDFLMQELNREANTLSSKSIDATMTKAAVEMKVLIEQMREQIQNVE